MESDTLTLGGAVIEGHVPREPTFQQGLRAIADAADGQRAEHRIRLLIIPLGHHEFADILGARQVDHRFDPGPRTRLIGEVLHPDFLDVAQGEWLGEDALGIDLQRVETAAGVDIGLVQETQAGSDDRVVADARVPVLEGSPIVFRRRENRRLAQDRDLLFGGVFLEIDQDRLTLGVVDHVPVGVTQLHLGPGLFLDLEDAGGAVGIEEHLAQVFELLRRQGQPAVGDIRPIHVQLDAVIARIVPFLVGGARNRDRTILVDGNRVGIPFDDLDGAITLDDFAFALQRIQHAGIGDRPDLVEQRREAVHGIDITELGDQGVFTEDRTDRHALPGRSVPPVDRLLDGGLDFGRDRLGRLATRRLGQGEGRRVRQALVDHVGNGNLTTEIGIGLDGSNGVMRLVDAAFHLAGEVAARLDPVLEQRLALECRRVVTIVIANRLDHVEDDTADAAAGVQRLGPEIDAGLVPFATQHVEIETLDELTVRRVLRVVVARRRGLVHRLRNVRQAHRR